MDFTAFIPKAFEDAIAINGCHFKIIDMAKYSKIQVDDNVADLLNIGRLCD